MENKIIQKTVTLVDILNSLEFTISETTSKDEIVRLENAFQKTLTKLTMYIKSLPLETAEDLYEKVNIYEATGMTLDELIQSN